MELDLSTIIVSYNTRALLSACLASFAREPQADREVIVVDNASQDDTVAYLKEAFPHVHVIANLENRGFAAASNQGLQQARGRYLCLLNPDTWLYPGALDALLVFLRQNPRVGLVGPTLLNPDGTYQHCAFRFPSLAQVCLDLFPLHHRLSNSPLNGRYPFAWYEQAFPIDYPLGACMMVRREVVDQVGPLDESYFMYSEEVDWCWRIKKAGWQIMHVPEARLVHLGGQSTKQMAGRMFVELHRSRFRFFRRNYGPRFTAAARAIVALGMLWQMARCLPARVVASPRSDSQEWWQSRAAVLRLCLGR